MGYGMNMNYMLMVMLPSMVLSGLASWMVKRSFAKYETVGTRSNMACHEAGHALQHATGYKALQMRSTLVPVTNLSSKMSMPVLMVGMLLMSAAPVVGQWVVLVGVALFAAAVVFSVITLPVEWDASARAKTAMVDAGIVTDQEVGGAGAVLNAAFLTYLASAIASIMTLLYYMHRAGLLGGRR